MVAGVQVKEESDDEVEPYVNWACVAGIKCAGNARRVMGRRSRRKALEDTVAALCDSSVVGADAGPEAEGGEHRRGE